jgi:hypothetical protein
MKYLEQLKLMLATSMYMQHSDETLTTYVWNRWNIWDIHLKTSLQHVQHFDILLQHRYKNTWNIWNTWNGRLQHIVLAQTSPYCLGEWIIVNVWSYIPIVTGCTQASSALATANWGGHEMCVGQALGELHVDELHTRSLWARAGEGLPGANRGGGGSGLPHHGGQEAQHSRWSSYVHG